MTQIVDATLANYISESISLVLEHGTTSLVQNISQSNEQIGSFLLSDENFVEDREYTKDEFVQAGVEYRRQAIARLLEQISEFDDRESRGFQLLLPVYNNGDENQSWWLDCIWLGDGKFAVHFDKPDMNTSDELVNTSRLMTIYLSALDDMTDSVNK